MSLVALVMLAAPAAAVSATDAVLAEVGAALDAGDAAHALHLANGGLQAPDTTALQRGRLLLDRGQAQELLGANEAALEDFTAALQTHALTAPERAQTLLQRGFLLDGMNKLNDAAMDYGAVIALKSEAVATALNNRANIYRRQNRLADAKRDYLAALAAGSDKAQYPFYGLGQIAEAQHDTQAARGFYAKAVAADPGYSLAADRLAALGGPPEGALAEPDMITLRRPAEKSPEMRSVASQVQAPPAPSVATPAAQTAQAAPESPVTLHPPKGMPLPPDTNKVVLPAPRARVTPRPALGGAASPGLRPALDGPSAEKGPHVQLGAWRSEPEAQTGWDHARAVAGAALEGLAARVVMADLPGKGRYFRLRVAAQDPVGLCRRLKAMGQACSTVRD